MTDRIFGHIAGSPLGTEFGTRQDLHNAGVHRPLQAGICGSQTEGADSVVVSGGYEDDEDRGDTIVYTGHGGNDPTTGEQVTDQELTRGNMALVLSFERRLPVRVVRGFGGNPTYSPSSGYRYDGLYEVARYWDEAGRSGHKVWRFELELLPDQDSIPTCSSTPDLHQRSSGTTQRQKLRTPQSFVCEACFLVKRESLRSATDPRCCSDCFP